MERPSLVHPLVDPSVTIGNRIGGVFVASVPVVVVLASVHGLSFGPVRHTGLMWMLTFVVGILLLAVRDRLKLTFPYQIWIPFFAITVASLTWGRINGFNLQLTLQMLTFAVVGLVASFVQYDPRDIRRMSQAYLCALIGITLFCVYFHLGPGKSIQGQVESYYFGFADRPAAMSLIPIASVFLAQFRHRPVLSVGVWAACVGVAVLSGSRMVTLVVLCLWMVHPKLASLRLRIVTVLVMAIVGLAAFNTPIIQDRFFQKKSGFSGKGTVEDVFQGKFDSAGRFEAWPHILEKGFEQFWLGHGVGQSAPYVLRIWAPMDKPHNEYLKVFFDCGVVGLAAFILGLLGTFWNLARINRQSALDENWPAAAAYMSLVGFILMSVFDNPLVSGVNFLHPTFALIGVANAIAAQQVKSETLSTAPPEVGSGMMPIPSRVAFR